MRWTLMAAFLFAATAAHAKPPPPGSLCHAAVQFLEAPTSEDHTRVALFYTPDPLSPDATAIIATEPHDEAAEVFYQAVVGRTQQVPYLVLAKEIGDCFRSLLRGGDIRFTTGLVSRTGYSYSKFTQDMETRRSIDLEASWYVCPAALNGTKQICMRLLIKDQ